jgi:hypothetical protein
MRPIQELSPDFFFAMDPSCAGGLPVVGRYLQVSRVLVPDRGIGAQPGAMLPQWWLIFWQYTPSEPEAQFSLMASGRRLTLPGEVLPDSFWDAAPEVLWEGGWARGHGDIEDLTALALRLANDGREPRNLTPHQRAAPDGFFLQSGHRVNGSLSDARLDSLLADWANRRFDWDLPDEHPRGADWALNSWHVETEHRFLLPMTLWGRKTLQQTALMHSFFEGCGHADAPNLAVRLGARADGIYPNDWEVRSKRGVRRAPAVLTEAMGPRPILVLRDPAPVRDSGPLGPEAWARLQRQAAHVALGLPEPSPRLLDVLSNDSSDGWGWR